MTQTVIFLLLHFVLCALLFIAVQRPAFVLANKWTSEKKLTFREFMKITRKGLRTDLSAAAYLTGIPLLALWAHAHIGFPVTAVLAVCEGIVALAVSLSAVADAVLYGPWRFKLDSSVFAYLRQPKGAFASVTGAQLAGAIAIVLAVAAAVFAALWGIVTLSGVLTATPAPPTPGGHLLTALVFVLCAAVLFGFIRGLNHRPNSPYMVYYCSEMFFNHAGVNPLFNVIFTITSGKKESRKFMAYDADEVEREMRRLLPVTGTPQLSLLTTDRPKNIVVVVWESLCSHFIAPLGGKGGVTVNFDRLCDQGVLFTRVDAGSYRTDPAMICTLSGYPGHPTTSLMRDSHLLPLLPALPRTLQGQGYSTTAVHGGDLSILHMIDYFLASGHRRVVSVDDMAADAPRGTWGVHDNYMFDWLYRDLVEHSGEPGRRFVTFLTLSSHQPYKVPYAKLHDEIDNSYAFTDEAFGRFIDRLRQTPVWDDTLVVVLGDHGIGASFLPMPRHRQPNIPVLLLGGVVRQPMRIDTIMAQTDLAATLLGQMGIDHSDYTFSRDILADTYTHPFSMHSYNNGFLLRDERGYTDYDNGSQRAVDGDDAERIRLGRMFLQHMMTDISKRQ